MTPVLLDTETTGFSEPVVPIQVCMIELEGDDPRTFTTGEAWTRKFNPGRPIDLGAMSTHYYYDELVKDFPKWDPEVLPTVDIFVGHSIDYDWKAVGSPESVRRICTHKMSERLWPDLDSHKLAAVLIYLLGPRLAIPRLQGAHDAVVDATNNLELVRAIAREWDISTWEEFYDLSEHCRIPTHMTFGKYGPDKSSGYKGMPIEEMVKTDWQYCSNFLLTKVDDLDPYLRKAIEDARANQT